MTITDIDPDMFVKAGAFTTKAHRDIYPAIDPTRPELSQAGKVVVITGASRGLGRLAFAASFARANAAAIILLGRSAADLAVSEKLVKECNPATQVLPITVDVVDEESVKDAFQEIVARFGVPHVLINNAGALASLKSIVDSDLDSWWKTQETNIKGTFVVTKAFLQKTGSSPLAPTTIINLASIASQGTPDGMSSYSISKLAVTKFTAYLNVEYPAITSVSLDPGIVPTDMAYCIPFLEPFMKDTPELAGGTSVWLSSGDKGFLSGRYISVNWDIDEIEKRKKEITDDNLLTMCLKGDFGGPNVVVDGSRK